MTEDKQNKPAANKPASDVTEDKNDTQQKTTSGKKQSSSTNKSAADKQSPAMQKKESMSESKTTSTTDISKPEAIKTKAKDESSSRISGTAIIALLLALIAIASAAYTFWLLRGEQQQFSEILADQQNQQTQLGDLLSRLEATQSELIQERNARQTLQTEQEALTSALDAISARLGRTTIAWRLAEVEYLLSLANHRLAFFNDSKTSIIILEAADARLTEIADPGLLAVRKAIADELVALQSVNETDISGLALNLGSLVDEVDQLPLIDKQRIATATASAAEVPKATSWRDIPRVVWENLKSLVQIRRHSQPLEPLLPAKESWYLTQNLRLKLEQARSALLHQDTVLFRQYLQEADSWIVSFYDNDSSAVKVLRENLSELLTIDLQPALPDISTSLRLLREFKARSNAMTLPLTEQESTDESSPVELPESTAQ